MPKVFRGTILQPKDPDFHQIDDGIVIVDQGVISGIASIDQIREGVELNFGLIIQGDTLLFEGQPVGSKQEAIFPTTNDFHDHTFQPPGIPGSLIENGPQGELIGWLPTTLRQGEALAKADLKKAEAMAKARLKPFVETGIGRVLQYTTSSVEAAQTVWEVGEALGLQVQVGYVAMDQGIDDIAPNLQTSGEEAIASTRKLLEQFHQQGKLKDVVVIDRFPIAVSSQTRKALAQLAREFGVGYETHIDESAGERDIHGGIYDGKSIVQVLIDDGVFEPGSRIGLAHAIHTSTRDMNQIGDAIAKGAKVSVRACPSSNAMLGSHFTPLEGYVEFPLKEWVARGVNITFGTDQGGGRTSSILREALLERGRHPANRQPSYRELLYYSTVSGVEETFGSKPSLEVGDKANFVVVKLAGSEGFYDGPEHYGDVEKTAARIIEGGQDSNAIVASYVDGRKIK